MEVKGRTNISRTKGSWTPNQHRVRFQDEVEDRTCWGWFVDQCDAFRSILSNTFCVCFEAIPSIGLMILALILLFILLGSIPLAVFLTYMAPEAQITEPPTQNVPMIRPTNVEWPTEFDSLFDDAQIIRSSSLVPANISSCAGFGFACTSHPDMIIGTHQRCDGHTDCPDGSDEYDCRECHTSFSCPGHGQSLRKVCLRGDSLCDGTHQCSNKEDELMYCGRTCESSEHECASRDRCIPLEFKCDGDAHCPDEDDEDNCQSCNNGAKLCASTGKCLPKWKLCNGVVDCPDGSDEKECDCRSCSGSEKALCNGAEKMCIKKSEVCDNIQHCPSGEDEQNCPGSCSASRTMQEFVNGRKRRALQSVKERTARDIEGSEIEFSGSGSGSGDISAEDDPSFEAGSAEEKLPRFRGMDSTEFRQEVFEPAPTDVAALDTIVCADNKTYSWKYACSGHFPQCDGKCKKCNEELAFMCSSGDRCIHRGYVCDGTAQCHDGSDEKNCDCVPGMEKCAMASLNGNRKCFAGSQRCDGFRDCPDGGDEKNCEICSGDAILCKAEKKCIPSIARCDGIEQCSDAQDEKECTCAECQVHPFSMYMCERGERCFRTGQICAPYTRCPDPTKMDKLYCATRNRPYF